MHSIQTSEDVLRAIGLWCSPQRRRVRKDIFSFDLPLRGRQIKNNLPCGHFISSFFHD
jgi:hypothetical protein